MAKIISDETVVCKMKAFPICKGYFVTVRVETRIVHTFDFEWLMACKTFWNVKILNNNVESIEIYSGKFVSVN